MKCASDKARFYFLCVLLGGIFGSGRANAQEILLSPNMCRDIIQHQPDGNVNVRPGQGKGGVMVAAADINPAGQDISDGIVGNTLRVPLTVDLATKLGIQSPEAVDMEAPLGTLVYRNGTIYFNDIAIDGVDPATIQTLCRSAVR